VIFHTKSETYRPNVCIHYVGNHRSFQIFSLHSFSQSRRQTSDVTFSSKRAARVVYCAITQENVHCK